MALLTPPAPTSITQTHEWKVIDTAANRMAQFTALQSNRWSELHLLTSSAALGCWEVGVRLRGTSTP